MSLNIRLSLGLSITRPNFTKFSARVACGQGSIVQWVALYFRFCGWLRLPIIGQTKETQAGHKLRLTQEGQHCTWYFFIIPFHDIVARHCFVGKQRVKVRSLTRPPDPFLLGRYVVETIATDCFRFVDGPILWGHSGPLCHALSLSLFSLSLSWTSMRRRRATVSACDSSDTWWMAL